LTAAHLNLSDALRQTGKFEQAMFHAQRTTELAPGASASWNILGAVSFDRDNLEVSREAFERAMALDPRNADAHSNIGNVEMRAGRVEMAKEHYEQALSLDDTHADAMVNLGTALQVQGELKEALGHYDRVIARHPKHADARWNRALTLLMSDDYEAGFEAYEARWDLPQFTRREFSGKPWDGAPLDGKRLLVTAEQGYGDTIQMARFLALLRDFSGEIVVETYPPLAPLIRGIAGISDVIPFGDALPDCDFHAPMMSLPHLLGTCVDSLPRDVPYLRGPGRDVPEALIDDENFKVGLVWRGRPSAKNFLGRPCPLEAFAPLTAIDSISLYSLQVGDPITDIAGLSWGEKIIDLGSSFTDFADTTTTIEALDLVVSIDTAVAHLAGALGAECWTLLSVFSDWRWGRDRSNSLWYPTMRLFRQSEPGRWDDVIDGVRQALTERLGA
ncbi:MAG: tetratricopeptide repeat protein, partial [Proteobacteria bacterium]|nr:tetratricopeptide repeat protein [Pseudomonadota bacterium]